MCVRSAVHVQEDHMALEVRGDEDRQAAADSIAMLRAGMETASADAVELEQRRWCLPCLAVPFIQ